MAVYIDDAKVLRLVRSRLLGVSELNVVMPDAPVDDEPSNGHEAVLSLANRRGRIRSSSEETHIVDVVIRVDVIAKPAMFGQAGSNALGQILGAIAAQLDRWAEASGTCTISVVEVEYDTSAEPAMTEHETGFVLAKAVVQETAETGPSIPPVS